jgi:GGDEF domain-containing protein
LRQVEDGPAGKDVASALARRVVEALSLPFFVSQEPARIGASVGILVTELASDAADGTASLLEQVDRALYAAKRAGGGRWQWSGDEGAAMDRAV